MTGTKVVVLLLLIAVPILGACAGDTTVDEPPLLGVLDELVQLEGYQVFSPQGEWLGEVACVLLDPETSTLGYVVLSYQEPWVYGQALMVTDPQRFVPIPWAQFKPGPKEGTLTLGADEMTMIPAPYLENAPDSLDAPQVLAIDHYWQSVDGKVN